MNTRRITYIALFTSAALVLHVVESALPPLLAFAPGARMGLANVVSLVALLLIGIPEAYAVLVARCLLGSLFGGNLFSLAYSLPAGLVALTVQLLLIRLVFPRLSLVSISFAGALAHNAVQLSVASLLVKVNLLPVLPLMLIASIIAGLGVGLCAFFAIKYLPPKFYLLPKTPLNLQQLPTAHTAKNSAATSHARYSTDSTTTTASYNPDYQKSVNPPSPDGEPLGEE